MSFSIFFPVLCNLPKGDDLRVEGTGGVPRQRCIIRIYEISANDPSGRLPPTQTKGIPSNRSKTPVAQMHFASELPLSRSILRMNIDVQKMIIQANPKCTFFLFTMPSIATSICQGEGKLLIPGETLA